MVEMALCDLSYKSEYSMLLCSEDATQERPCQMVQTASGRDDKIVIIIKQ